MKLEKNINDIWERLHGIAIGTGGIGRSIDELTQAINKNSDSSNFLAKVGIFVGIVGALATIIGTIFGILSFIYK